MKTKLQYNIYSFILKSIIHTPIAREALIKKLKKELYKAIIENNDKDYPKESWNKTYQFFEAMIDCTKRAYDKGYISKKIINQTIDNFIKNNFFSFGELNKIRTDFKQKYKIDPPLFIDLSPTEKCNLQCIGCYASAKFNAPTLPYNILEKLIDELYNEWGQRFMVISGGEPFMYKSNGKDIFDIFKRYNKMYFLVYTNGTLLTKENCAKLAKLGNVIPAISIEGFENETDERRGKGIYKKVLEAMKNLREAGVPFGASITATKKNINILLKDEIYDFLFLEQCITHLWMFQLMPIGKGNDVKELMITPEQRVKLYRKWEQLLKDKKYLIADFWNSGVLTQGCIAYGREAGYLYIDSKGNIMPCVFVPYYEDNAIDLIKSKKKVATALFSPLFVNGRKWQDEYGFRRPLTAKNQLMPCSIRDHWENFEKNILPKNAKPENIQAKDALKSKSYSKILKDFDKELKELTEPIWQKEFKNK